MREIDTQKIAKECFLQSSETRQTFQFLQKESWWDSTSYFLPKMGHTEKMCYKSQIVNHKAYTIVKK